MANTLQPHGPQPARLLCPWDFPSKNTGLAFHALLQEICLTQRSNPRLLHYRQILYCWATNQSVWKYSGFCVQCFTISWVEVDFCFFVFIPFQAHCFPSGDPWDPNIPGAWFSCRLSSSVFTSTSWDQTWHFVLLTSTQVIARQLKFMKH